MATVQTTTSAISNFNVATLLAQIDTLKANMERGKNITAADVSLMFTVYNSIATHIHTFRDLRGIDTYGNRSYYGRSGYYVTHDVDRSTTLNAVTAPVTIAPGANITASDIRVLINAINTLTAPHVHKSNDLTS